MNEAFESILNIQVVVTFVLVAIWTVILWRGIKAMAPSRKSHDVIRLRRLLAFVSLWLTAVALLVGAMYLVDMVSQDFSRGVYAALRVVLFIVGISILFTWDPEGMTYSDDRDEIRLRRVGETGQQSTDRKAGDQRRAEDKTAGDAVRNAQAGETQDQREDRQFGEERRNLEDQHNEDRS